MTDTPKWFAPFLPDFLEGIGNSSTRDFDWFELRNLEFAVAFLMDGPHDVCGLRFFLPTKKKGKKDRRAGWVAVRARSHSFQKNEFCGPSLHLRSKMCNYRELELRHRNNARAR